MRLKDMRIAITGVGLKPVGHIFRDIVTGEPCHTAVFDKCGKEYKANIGTATAYECAKEGATVHLISRTDGNLQIVKDWILKDIPNANIECTALDLNETQYVAKWANKLPNDKRLYWVQSVGISSGGVNVDQPYTKIEDTSVEQLKAELSPSINTFEMIKILLPRFRKQDESRIAIVSSMSAVRSFTQCVPHCTGKGAISRLANAAMIDLHKDNIFISDIRPGIVDTGMYDRDGDINIVRQICRGFGYEYTENLPAMPASDVGEAICMVLKSKAHFPSINMVAKGQFPHENS